MIVVAGPEGSGTTLLARLLEATGAEVVQRSLPWAGVWWLGPQGEALDPPHLEPYPEGTLFVVIQRDARCTALSVLRRRLAPSLVAAHWQRSIALDRLRSLPAFRVTYEALVEDPLLVLSTITDHLGLPALQELPEEVHDANAKWGVEGD